MCFDLSIDGKVSTITPLNINPKFSHFVTLWASVKDNSYPLDGMRIKSIVESSDFQADRDFK